MRTLLTLSLFGGSLLLTHPLAAQEEVQAVLRGQLLLAGSPADTGTVILHQVNPEIAQAIDSLQVNPDGTFSFTLPRLPIPASGEVYFVSARESGVMYLGPVIGEPAILDSLYVVPTFPSVPAPAGGIRFPVNLRELWIQEGPSGWLLTDTFILTNTSAETYLPAEGGGIVWSYPLPQGARNLRVLDGGLLQGEIQLEGSEVISGKPLTPGSSRYIVQYDLPSLDFEVPLPGDVEIMRLVMEEPAPAVQVGGLARMEPVEIEPGEFVAYWAGEGLVDQEVSLSFGEVAAPVPAVVWFALGLGGLLALAGIWGVNRRTISPARTAGGEVVRDRSSVLLDIAQLDLAFDGRGGAGFGREEYHARRAALMRELERSR